MLACSQQHGSSQVREDTEFLFTYEPEFDGFTIGSYDCRAQVTVIDDGEDWQITAIEVCGVDYKRPHAGDLRAERTEKWFPAETATPSFADAMRAEAERVAGDKIGALFDAGEIGPAIRRETAAEYRRDMAREAAE